jgi:carboxylesterase type B
MNLHLKYLLVLTLGSGTLAATSPEGDDTYTPVLVSDGKISPDTQTINITIPAGTIIGSVSAVETFNGIPYAESPAGLERLKPPKRRKELLDGFDATGKAASCPQMPFRIGQVQTATTNASIAPAVANLPIFNTDSTNESEDCLTISVQRPLGTTSADSLPVLFWIYGGGFAAGGTSTYNAEHLMQFAKERSQDFIFVAVNYRVSGFGFLGGAEVKANGSSNLGLLDQRMGLEWVADNIAAFGGNSSRVTIAGESAGAISVFDQMLLFGGDATYGNGTLFQGAIMSSGSAAPVDPIDSPRAQEIYDGVVSRANCSGSDDTLDCLRRCNFSTIADAINNAPGIFSYSSLALSYLPRPDEKVLENSSEIMVKAGRYHAVPVIIGDQEDEGTLFSLPQTNVTSTERLVEYFQKVIFAHATEEEVADFVAKYPEDSAAGSPFRTEERWDKVYLTLYEGWLPINVPGFKRMAAILGDLVFTLVRRLAIEYMVEQHPEKPVWSYLNSYAYNGTWPMGQFGTFHGSDLSKIFKGVDMPANSTRTYWLNFLHNLDPNVGGGVGEEDGDFPSWPAWQGTEKLLWVNATEIGYLDDNFRDASYQYMKANVSRLYF